MMDQVCKLSREKSFFFNGLLMLFFFSIAFLKKIIRGKCGILFL